VSSDPALQRVAQGGGLALCAVGSWTAPFAPLLERIVADAEKLAGSNPSIVIDVSRVAKLDTFGAWLIERLRRSLTQGPIEARISGLSTNYASLVDEVRRVDSAPAVAAAQVTITGILAQVGVFRRYFQPAFDSLAEIVHQLFACVGFRHAAGQSRHFGPKSSAGLRMNYDFQFHRV